MKCGGLRIKNYRDFEEREKINILEIIKEIYINSNIIVWQDLEVIQKEKFGGICYKKSTIIKRASQGNWSSSRRARQEKEKENYNLELVRKESEGEEVTNSLLRKAINKRYSEDFAIIKDDLLNKIKDKKFKETKDNMIALKALRELRDTELELRDISTLEAETRIRIELNRKNVPFIAEVGSNKAVEKQYI